MPSPILIHKSDFKSDLKRCSTASRGRLGKMIKWVRVLFTLRRSEFRWPKPCGRSRGERGQPHRVTSRTATCCHTGVTAPGFISKVPVRLSRVHRGLQKRHTEDFYIFEANTPFPRSKCVCSFISSLSLPSPAGTELCEEGARGTSLPGQDRARRNPAAAPGELEIKEDGTGNFKFPLPAEAGDAEVAAGSLREPQCKAEDKSRMDPKEEVGRPHPPRMVLGCESPRALHEPPASHYPGLSCAPNPPQGRGTKGEKHPSSPFHKHENVLKYFRLLNPPRQQEIRCKEP